MSSAMAADRVTAGVAGIALTPPLHGQHAAFGYTERKRS